jgi:hypothetical protein
MITTADMIRHRNTGLPFFERSVSLVCLQLKRHALDWEGEAPAEPLPSLRLGRSLALPTGQTIVEAARPE